MVNKYMAAGVVAAALVGAAGTASELEPGGPALGVIEDAEFITAAIQLLPGDTIIALTDGVTDAVNAGGERFGGARLDATVAQGRMRSAGIMVEQILVERRATAHRVQVFWISAMLALIPRTSSLRLAREIAVAAMSSYVSLVGAA